MDRLLDEPNVALGVVLEVAEEHEHTPEWPDNFVALNCGAVLEVLGITPEAYNAVIRKFDAIEPQPPIVELKSKGREQENPNDPKYIKDHDQWKSNRTFALLLVLYALGVKVAHVPEGMPGPDSQEWMEEFSLSGLQQTGSPKERLIAWIQYKAISLNKTLGKVEREAILLAAIRQMGVAEQDVQDAIKRP